MNTEKLSLKTLPKNGIMFNWAAIDEIEFATAFFRDAQEAYKLPKITNGHIKANIPIVDMHPLAMLETMKGDQAKLPIIGIEHVHTTPDQLILGNNQSAAYGVDETFIKMLEDITPENRMFTAELPAQLRSLLATRGDNNPLYIFRNTMLERSSIQISAWSGASETNRYIKKFIKSVMIEFYRAIQKQQVKPEIYSLQPNLYNFDYGETLYGCELEMPFLMPNANYIVDIDLTELKHFDIGIYDSNAKLYDAEHVAWFSVAGLEDRMRIGKEAVILKPP